MTIRISESEMFEMLDEARRCLSEASTRIENLSSEMDSATFDLDEAAGKLHKVVYLMRHGHE